MQYRVKEIREEKGISQETLAKKSGVSRATISGLESGKVKITSTKTLSKIAKALDKKMRDRKSSRLNSSISSQSRMPSSA